MMDRFTSIHYEEEIYVTLNQEYPSINEQIQEAIEMLWDHTYTKVLSILIQEIERRMKGVALIAGKMWRIVFVVSSQY